MRTSHIQFKVFILVAFAILLSSCAKEEDTTSNIPESRVEIDINIILENKFSNPFYSQKYYNGTGTTLYAGYAGVIVISNVDSSQLYAYDLCCPHEAPLKNELQLSGSLKVKCPKCKSEFNIADGTGRVESGSATERLKRYRVLKDGNFFRVRH